MTDDTTATSSGPTADELASENAELRAQLQAENDKLRAQVAEAQQATSGGHTDEDVRRLEHPEEFPDSRPADEGNEEQPTAEAEPDRSAEPLAAAPVGTVTGADTFTTTTSSSPAAGTGSSGSAAEPVPPAAVEPGSAADPVPAAPAPAADSPSLLERGELRRRFDEALEQGGEQLNRLRETLFGGSAQ